jgi:hypothetical protein
VRKKGKNKKGQLFVELTDGLTCLTSVCTVYLRARNTPRTWPDPPALKLTTTTQICGEKVRIGHSDTMPCWPVWAQVKEIAGSRRMAQIVFCTDARRARK